MTEKLLRDSLTEAKSNGEVGLFIWANWRVWDDLAYEMKQGNKYYDVAISKVLKQEKNLLKNSRFSHEDYLLIEWGKWNRIRRFEIPLHPNLRMPPKRSRIACERFFAFYP